MQFSRRLLSIQTQIPLKGKKEREREAGIRIWVFLNLYSKTSSMFFVFKISEIHRASDVSCSVETTGSLRMVELKTEMCLLFFQT